ncbi:MAG: hypothetical protein [Microviridae sp.]|nr:MAG: hypothetical protein [Microviridae sp.]
MARDLLSLLEPAAPSPLLTAAPPPKPRDLFAWPDPAAPDYFDQVLARGWRLIERFRVHTDCALMRSDRWPSAEDFVRDRNCVCDQCHWRAIAFRDGTPDARGEAARLLRNRIRRYAT